MTKIAYLLFFLFVFAVALVFSLLNLDPVKIYLYKGFFIQMPLALALTFELLAGVVIGYSVTILRSMKLKTECSGLRKQLENMQHELQNLRQSQSAKPE